MNKFTYEKEAFGVSYDRFMLYELHKILIEKYNIKNILEIPSFGAKAAPSLYSLSFAKLGANVTIVDANKKMLEYWKELNLDKNLRIRPQKLYNNTDFRDNNFDLVWNFVTFSYVNDVNKLLAEMFRVTKKYVLIVSCNNFQIGYPWHRILHKLYGLKWNHGNNHYNYPWNLKKCLKQVGFEIKEYGTIDSPPWPDPVGFRDIHLHKKSAEVTLEQGSIDWEVPFVNYLKNEKFPLWMKLLKIYDKGLHRYNIKLPFSHLYYVLGEKM